MSAKEAERSFLANISDHLLSLPFDLKVLQEAASDPDLDPAAREIAAGAITYALLPQEGDGPLRFVDDILLVRAAFAAVAAQGGDAFDAFRARFPEIYDQLDEETRLYEQQLAGLWHWIAGKIASFPRLTYKGKRAAQYLESEDNLALLYEEGLEFQTNYNVTEEQVRNKLRRQEQIVELLSKRKHAEEAKKISAA
ncbi:MAG: hypothetical protein EXR72_03200 [Myxococcales bacterium]|nr:hypothetical protein [Myxococcales bacterium]